MFAAGPTPLMRAHLIGPARPEQRPKHATFSCSGSFSKQQNVGDEKTRAHDDEADSASYETQVAVEKAGDGESGDEEQSEIRPGNAICPNAAREDVDPKQERITIHDGGRDKRAVARFCDAPRDRDDDWGCGYRKTEIEMASENIKPRQTNGHNWK